MLLRPDLDPLPQFPLLSRRQLRRPARRRPLAISPREAAQIIRAVNPHNRNATPTKPASTVVPPQVIG